MSDVKVVPVPKGSIVWLNDIDFVDDAMLDHTRQAIAEACGHEGFVILQTFGGGTVEVVLGPDDLVARVRAAVALATAEQAVAPVRACRFCGCTDDRACEVPGGCYWLEREEYDYDVCSACDGLALASRDAEDRGVDYVHADTLIARAREMYERAGPDTAPVGSSEVIAWADLAPDERRWWLTRAGGPMA